MAIKGTVKTYEVSKAIARQLETFTQDVVDEINEKGTEIARRAQQELRDSSPGPHRWYAKGWTFKTLEFYKAPWRFTIHNKTHYQIAHLLEKGWTMRNGKRHGPVKVHIKPVHDMVVEEYTKAVEEAIANASK